MNLKSLSVYLIHGILAGSLFCASPGWSADPQRGIQVTGDRPLVLSGIRGNVQAASLASQSSIRGIQFGDTLQYGDQLVTGPQSRAEILIGQQELVTLEENASVRIFPESHGMPVVHLQNGAVRLAVAESQLALNEQVTVQTPSTKAMTRGGVFHVAMEPQNVHASSPLTNQEGGVVLASYPSSLVAEQPDSFIRYQVEEGTLTVEANGQSILVNAGQSVDVVDGQLGVPFATIPGQQSAVPLTAMAHHRETPETGISHLASQEMKQAEILGIVLGSVASQAEQFEEQEKSEQNVVLATTGSALGGGSNTLPPLGNSFPVASEFGGPTSSLIDPAGNDNFNIVIGPAGPTIPQAVGGGGLVLYDNSDITLNAQLNNGNGALRIQYTPINSELLLVDGGNPTLAPHQGQVPSERLTIHTLVGGDFLPVDLINRTPGRPLFLPFPSAVPSGDPIELENAANISHVFTRFTDSSQQANTIGVLETYAGSTQVIPGIGDQDVIFPPKFLAGSGSSSEESTDGVHGVIRARQASGGGMLNIPGGVVLNNDTNLTTTTTGATSTYFTQTGDIKGSVLAVLGRNFDVQVEDQILVPDESVPDFIQIIPGSAGGGQLNPVDLKMQDRVLAVLDGSTIAPDKSDPLNIPRVSLLTILDSRLEGPTEPPVLGSIPGDVFPGGSTPPQVNGLARTRPDIPPLIEILNSGTHNLPVSDPNFEWAVETHSAMIVRGDLHQGILEASAPLVSLFQGTMMTTGDFANVQGHGTPNSARLMASLQQSNVLQAAVQLNNSQLQVGGHLFNFLNGATGQVTGNLTALANNSLLSVNGALLAVGSNSSFSLSGGSLVAFGFGTNTVNITGTSGGCVGCTLSTTIPNLAGIPVLLHPSATLSVGGGFVPYAGVGQGTIGGVDFNNSVTVSPGAAVLQVDQGGTLVLNP
ncbi:MAG: FecR domain-containing protein [Nitrospirales bacterium]